MDVTVVTEKEKTKANDWAMRERDGTKAYRKAAGSDLSRCMKSSREDPVAPLRNERTAGSEPDSLFSTREVARRLALHERTVRRLVAAGELRPVRFGRAVRFRHVDVEQLIDRHQERPFRDGRPKGTRPARTSFGSFAARLRSLEG